MGAVICDASFHARCKYELTLRPRLLRLQSAWPDASTVRGFRERLATEDLAVAMNFKSPRKVATAPRLTFVVAGGAVSRATPPGAASRRPSCVRPVLA